MNVYDFDKTIYRSDSSLDFYLFNLRTQPRILIHLPKQMWALFLYQIKRISKTEMKSIFYQYFASIDQLDQQVEIFWQKHKHKLMPYYLSQKKEDDVIISASPVFLLQPICDELKVHLIASVVDKTTGFSEENCYGEAKVRRFRELYPEAKVEAFYSDSRSDTPMAKQAERAFFVTGDRIEAWPN